MKILVTGGTGFLGSELTQQLIDKGHEVVVLDNLSAGSKENIPKEAEFIKGDIRNREDVERASEDVEAVFHLAAKISVSESMKKPDKYMDHNVTGTTNILETNKDKKIVNVSSAAAYGTPQEIPIKEQHPLLPESFYGVSKKLAEQACKSYREIYDTNITIARPFNIYGEGQNPDNPYAGVITIFIDRAKNDKPLTIYGDGEQTRDFIHKKDVARALIKILGENKTFNIGTGKEITINQLAKTIKEVTKSNSKIEHTEPREGDIERSCSDVKKLKKTGWEPKINLKEGLKINL